MRSGAIIIASMVLIAACGSRSYQRIPPIRAEVTISEEAGSWTSAHFRACFLDPADQQEGKTTLCGNIDPVLGVRIGASCTYYEKRAVWGWLDLGTVRLEDRQGQQPRFPVSIDGPYSNLVLPDGRFDPSVRFDRAGPLTLHAAGGPDAEGFTVEFPAVPEPKGDFSYVGGPSLSSGLAVSWQGVNPTAKFSVSLSYGELYAGCSYDTSSSRLVDPEVLQRFAAAGATEIEINLYLEEHQTLEIEGSRYSIERYRPISHSVIALEP